MLTLKEPVKAVKSDNYLTVLVDADDVHHYWLPNGTYDGHDRPCRVEKAAKESKPQEK